MEMASGYYLHLPRYLRGLTYFRLHTRTISRTLSKPLFLDASGAPSRSSLHLAHRGALFLLPHQVNQQQSVDLPSSQFDDHAVTFDSTSTCFVLTIIYLAFPAAAKHPSL